MQDFHNVGALRSYLRRNILLLVDIQQSFSAISEEDCRSSAYERSMRELCRETVCESQLLKVNDSSAVAFFFFFTTRTRRWEFLLALVENVKCAKLVGWLHARRLAT